MPRTTRIGRHFDARDHGTVLLAPRNAQTFSPGAITFNHVAINDGLIGYWKLDETSGTVAADSSGYGRNGTHKNDTILSTDVAPLSFKNDRSLDASDNSPGNSYVVVSGATLASTFKFSATQDFTVSAWIKTTDSTFYHQPVGNEDVNNRTGFSLLIEGSTGKPYFTVRNSCCPSVAGVTPVNNGQWHHLTGVRSGDRAYIYVDGVLEGTLASGAAVSLANASDFLIGNDPGGAFPYDGKVDDVRLYNRALTAAEITRLAAGSQPRTSSGSVTLVGNLSVSGSLLLNAGTLDVSSSLYSIAASGSWLNSGGIFTPRTGTVTLNGTSPSLLSGGSSFSTLILARSTTVTLADAATVSTILSIGAGSTLALPGYDLTATSATISNAGTINETSGGGILHPSTVSVSPASLAIGANIAVTLADADENIDGTALDTVGITVAGESLTLTESAVASGIFQGSIATTHGAQIQGNGIIENDANCSFATVAGFTDAQDSADTATATAIVTDAAVSCEQAGGGGSGRGRGGVSETPSQGTASSRASVSFVPSIEEAPMRQFSDVPSDAWFFPFVMGLVDRNIISGYRDERGNVTGEFGPADPVTVGQVLKIGLLAGGHELPIPAGIPKNPSAIDWSAPYVALAESLELSLASEDVQRPATRGEVINVLLEASDIDPISSGHPFSDLAATHAHAKAIVTAYKLGIVMGDTDASGKLLNTVRPDDQINRAEVAKIIAILIEVMK